MTTAERNDLITQVIPVLTGIARKLRAKVKRVEVEEAVSAACLAVVERAHKYDPARGTFKAFAGSVGYHAMLLAFGLDQTYRREPMHEKVAGLYHDNPPGREDEPLRERFPSPCPTPEQQLIDAEQEASIEAELGEDESPEAAADAYRKVYGAEPVAARPGPRAGRERSAKWYANLTPEKRAERNRKRRDRRAEWARRVA